MANLSVSIISFLLVLSIVNPVKGCEVTVRGGGCPGDVVQCVQLCAPCWRRIGKVTAFCRPAGGGIPFDECVCSFSDGAPCPPPDPPRCPGPWSPPSPQIIFNQTHV